MSGGEARPSDQSDARTVVRGERRAVKAFLQEQGMRLLLLFVGLLLPMWGFLELADEVRDADPFPFDRPVLLFAQDIAWDRLKTLPGILPRRDPPHTALYPRTPSAIRNLKEAGQVRPRTCR